MPLPRLELETSGFDTILSCMHQPIQPKSPKSLSFWEEVGNLLILHNIIESLQELSATVTSRYSTQSLTKSAAIVNQPLPTSQPYSLDVIRRSKIPILLEHIQ